MTTADVITDFAIPTSGDSPSSITTGPDADGNLWFTDVSGNKIGRVMPVSSPSSQAAATARVLQSMEASGIFTSRTCSRSITSVTAGMEGSATTMSPTRTSPCSPTSSLVASGRRSTYSMVSSRTSPTSSRIRSTGILRPRVRRFSAWRFSWASA